MRHIYSVFCEEQEARVTTLPQLFACALHAIQDSKVDILVDEFSSFQMNVLAMHGQNMVSAAAV
jgi:hypothetical protein